MTLSSPHFFRRCGQVALALFFVSLFIPLKLHVHEAPFFFGGDFNPYQDFFLYLSDIFFLGAFLAFSFHFFRHPLELKQFRFGTHSIIFFWLVLFVLADLSLFFSSWTIGTSFDSFLHFLLLLRFFECFFLYVALLNELFSLRHLFLILVFGLAGESILGLFQYIFGSSVGATFLGEPPLRTNMTDVSSLSVGGHRILRAYGTFLHPNIFAAYLLLGLFAVKNLYKQRPYLYGSLAVILLIGLLLTFSRTAFFAGLGGLVVYYFLTKRRLHWRAITIIGTVLVLFLISFNVGDVFLSRMKFQDDQSLQFRGENLNDGLSLIFTHPLGVGLGNSSLALQQVVSHKLSPWEYQPPHNLFLAVASELGLAGSALYLFLFVYLSMQLYRRRRLAPQVFSVWVAVIILSLFDHYFFSLYHGEILFALFFAIAAMTLQHQSPDFAEEESRGSV